MLLANYRDMEGGYNAGYVRVEGVLKFMLGEVGEGGVGGVRD